MTSDVEVGTLYLTVVLQSVMLSHGIKIILLFLEVVVVDGVVW